MKVRHEIDEAAILLPKVKRAIVATAVAAGVAAGVAVTTPTHDGALHKHPHDAYRVVPGR